MEIFKALTEKSEPQQQELVIDQGIEQTTPEADLAEVPKTLEEQKKENEAKAKQVSDKETRINEEKKNRAKRRKYENRASKS